MTEQFPPNPVSRRQAPPRPEPQAEEKKVERVATGKVVTRKRPWRKRVTENVLGGDVGSVWGYMFGEVLVPAARDMIVDAITGGVERAVFGEARGPSRRGYRGPVGHVAYNRYGSPGGANVRGNVPARDSGRYSRIRNNFEEVIVETLPEASEVLDRMWDLANRYPNVTVADMYEMVGKTPQFTHERWGWTAETLAAATPSRVRLEGGRHGYLLNLPEPEPIT